MSTGSAKAVALHVTLALPVALGLLAFSGCLRRPTDNPNVLVVGVTTGPNNLDPRIGTDDVSGKTAQLIFNGLMTLDDHMRVVPKLAERLDQSGSAHLRRDAAPRASAFTTVTS